jgi:hypothetical protein
LVPQDLHELLEIVRIEVPKELRARASPDITVSIEVSAMREISQDRSPDFLNTSTSQNSTGSAYRARLNRSLSSSRATAFHEEVTGKILVSDRFCRCRAGEVCGIPYAAPVTAARINYTADCYFFVSN